jgi:hypothetical protein
VDLGEFHIEGMPGGPFRIGSLKWAAALFAGAFLAVFLCGLLFAPLSPSLWARLAAVAYFSLLSATVVIIVVWPYVLYLRFRKRAPLLKQHRLRQPRNKRKPHS